MFDAKIWEMENAIFAHNAASNCTAQYSRILCDFPGYSINYEDNPLYKKKNTVVYSVSFSLTLNFLAGFAAIRIFKYKREWITEWLNGGGMIESFYMHSIRTIDTSSIVDFHHFVSRCLAKLSRRKLSCLSCHCHDPMLTNMRKNRSTELSV